MSDPESVLPPAVPSFSTEKVRPKIAIHVPCYEGPDDRGPGTLTITEEQLSRHVFVTGTTGAGKSTLLRQMMRQLMAANCSDHEWKAGLVVLDFKGDDTVEFVQAAAAAAGRSADVRILSLESEISYDFFAGCDSLERVTEYAQRLVFGCGMVDPQENKFWDDYRQALFSAALLWLSLTRGGDRSFSRWISHAASWLLSDSFPSNIHEDLLRLRNQLDAMRADSPERMATQNALQLIESWKNGLDFRTKSNARATVQLALRPLLEIPTQRLFRSDTLLKFDVRHAVEKGRILVVSIKAFLHPELASLIGKCLKADFYKSVFARKPGGRFVSLVADEFQLSVTTGSPRHDDCYALPLLRSQNAGVIAASQTLAGIDRAVGGNQNRRILLCNFSLIFFLRSTETEVENWAQQVCGTVETDVIEREKVNDLRGSGSLAEEYVRVVTRRVKRAVCEPGSLARLQTGQAYVLQEGRSPLAHPIWIAGDAP